MLGPAFRPPGQTDRQGGRLLTRMVDWFPGANPGQFPHLPGLGIRTEAGHGGSLGRVVTVVVTELVLLLSLGVLVHSGGRRPKICIVGNYREELILGESTEAQARLTLEAAGCKTKEMPLQRSS